MIFLLSLLLCSTLCRAQINGFGTGTSLSQASSLTGVGAPLAQVGGTSSAVAGTVSAQAAATAAAGTPGYAACVQSQPDTAVRSKSPFAYSLLESTFTNPALIGFYDTAFNLNSLYQVIYDELKATSPHDAQLIAGSVAILFEKAFPRVSPLVNAVTITNAISEFLALKVVITTEEFDDYVDAFINSVSKGLRNEDGTPKSNAKAIVTALLNYLAHQGDLSFSSLNQFISILAGYYRIALYSTCLPSTFGEIPSP